MSSSSSLSPSLGVSADTLSGLTTQAAQLGTALDSAFAKAVTQGKTFDATIKTVEQSLVSLLAKAASNQLEQNLSSLFGASSASSSSESSSALIPFATGGIVSTPTILSQGANAALTGEAGPEAIMPLQRGPDGSLGLKGGAATTVNVTVHAQDLDSFRRSEAQIAAAMTRALQRGRRAM